VGGDDVPQKATEAASAKDASVHVRFKFARSGMKLWPRPMVVALTPDDAMALSIELQKAAIDARQNEYRRTACALDSNPAPA
jgi:hypothetical protein